MVVARTQIARAFIGTSGWNYRQWRGDFFPRGLPTKQWLSFYASCFDSVEVNYSFYRLPSKEICETWYQQTPEPFRFVMKASRYITHIKRLRNARESWDIFLERVLILKQKLGPILLQFPSSFQATEANLQAVDDFLQYAGKTNTSRRLALEFRHRSCFGQEMLAILRKHRAALVISHSSRYPVPEIAATSDFVYFRFHGPTEMFASSYSNADLRDWAEKMKTFLSMRDVYAYFNNDSGGHAPRNAQVLLRGLQPRSRSVRQRSETFS